jgi:hypothetical protein
MCRDEVMDQQDNRVQATQQYTSNIFHHLHLEKT